MGKRIGKCRWFATTPKTVEGSTAFTGSVVLAAVLLRGLGYAEAFSVRRSAQLHCMMPIYNLQILRYAFVIFLSSLLEAFSDQNDNLTLPLFMWSMQILLNV